MNIRQINENKQDYMPLLLLADERESDIEAYLNRGDLFALYDPERKAVCVVTDEGEHFELQNLAVDEKYQRQGYGSALVKHLFAHYANRGKPMRVATGDVPSHVSFYESCGFVFHHRVEDYFVKRFDYPIFENGAQLRDQVYFVKELDYAQE